MRSDNIVMKKVKLQLSCGLLILILALALGLVLYLGTLRESGRRCTCICQLKQLGLAMHLYEADHYQPTAKEEAEGKWPYSPRFIPPDKITDLIRYLGGDDRVRIFFCPTKTLKFSSEQPKTITDLTRNDEWMSYDFLATQTLGGEEVERSIQPILCDKPGNHGKDGINIVFADGHVVWWPGTVAEFARSNRLVITAVTNWVR